MIPLVFINLDKDAERRSRLEHELARLQVSGQRLPAIWWKLLDTKQQQALYDEALNAQQYYKPLVDGEKGCYASHIAAWRRLLNSDAPAMVVLEDDVRLDDAFAQVIDAITAMPHAWDMVKLMGREHEKVCSAVALTPTHQLIQYRRVPSFTAGYVISRNGAEKLLKSRIPFGRPIDIDLRFWWENDMQILGVQPPPVLLDDTSLDTSITGRKPSPSWTVRWRKLCMKWRLTQGNARHLSTQLPLR